MSIVSLLSSVFILLNPFIEKSPYTIAYFCMMIGTFLFLLGACVGLIQEIDGDEMENATQVTNVINNNDSFDDEFEE